MIEIKGSDGGYLTVWEDREQNGFVFDVKDDGNQARIVIDRGAKIALLAWLKDPVEVEAILRTVRR